MQILFLEIAIPEAMNRMHGSKKNGGNLGTRDKAVESAIDTNELKQKAISRRKRPR